VFGFAGLVLPVNEVRSFGTWFFQHKCQLLDFELERSGEHPAQWEKKGSSLYTVTNLESHRYQTIQAADWIAALVGRLGAVWSDPESYSENGVFRRYFEHRLNRISRRSGIRQRSAENASLRVGSV